MSKENVFSFLTHAAKDEYLKAKLEEVSGHEGVIEVANEAGYC